MSKEDFEDCLESGEHATVDGEPQPQMRRPWRGLSKAQFEPQGTGAVANNIKAQQIALARIECVNTFIRVTTRSGDNHLRPGGLQPSRF